MIFRIAFIFKILLVLTVGETAYRFFRKKLSLKSSVLLVALIAIFAVFANAASERLPPLRDTVTLTALGEKREDAKKEEVYLSGFTVDGKGYNCLESLEIREGKWFWNGEKYCWRIETDPRQPEGMTRRVVLGIPVGRERSLDFAGSIWRGKVEIQTEGQTWVVDTYAENEETISESIGSSRPSMLLKSELCQLLVFLIAFGVLVAVEVFAFLRSDQLFRFVEKYKWPLIYAAIAFFQLMLAMRYAGIDCFWVDELCEIGWSVEANNLMERAFAGLAPLPIYYTFLHFWYLIAPYGEAWLLLPMEIATAVGVFVIGLAARECKGNEAGMFATAFAASSYFVLYQCSYEIRSYAFYFCFASILLFLYLKRLKIENRISNKMIAAQCIVMILFAGMHYHALIHCAALFILDVFLFLKKRLTFRCFLPYILTAISYIPSGVYIISTQFIERFNGWHVTPGIHEVNQLLNELTGNSKLQLSFLIIAISVFVVKIYTDWISSKKKTDLNELIFFLPCYLIIFVVCFFVFYGNYINPKATLWGHRYFSDLLPSCYVLCGIGAVFLHEFVSGNIEVKREKKIIFLIAVLLLTVPFSLDETVQTAQKVREPYRQAADWIYQQSNKIFLDSTAVLVTGEEGTPSGWDEYYIQRQGRRDPIHVFHCNKIGEKVMGYDIIYLVQLHGSANGSVKEILNEYYTQVEKNDYATVYQRK